MTDYLINVISASIGTGIAEILTLPICTIRTNYINQNVLPNQNKQSIRQIIQLNYSQYGFKWFVSAKYSAIFGQILSTSSKYSLYRFLPSIKKELGHGEIENKILDNISNGIIGGVVTCSITQPLDYIKINQQMHSTFALSDMYKGFSRNLTKATIGGASFFPIYDLTKSYTSNSILSSFVSAVISTTLMQPFDYAKVRKIYGKDLGSIKNIYTGLSLNLLRIVPHFIITMYITENVSKSLNH